MNASLQISSRISKRSGRMVYSIGGKDESWIKSRTQARQEQLRRFPLSLRSVAASNRMARAERRLAAEEFAVKTHVIHFLQGFVFEPEHRPLSQRIIDARRHVEATRELARIKAEEERAAQDRSRLIRLRAEELATDAAALIAETERTLSGPTQARIDGELLHSQAIRGKAIVVNQAADGSFYPSLIELWVIPGWSSRDHLFDLRLDAVARAAGSEFRSAEETTADYISRVSVGCGCDARYGFEAQKMSDRERDIAHLFVSLHAARAGNRDAIKYIATKIARIEIGA